MHYEPDSLYHVYNRGNNGQQLFFEPGHYHHFLRLFRQHVAPTVKVIAYCLMPNHFHFLLLTTQKGTRWDESASSARQPMVRGLAKLLSAYSQGLNEELGRKGALFQPKTKGKLLDGPFCEAGYPLLCFQYIHSESASGRAFGGFGRLVLLLIPGLRRLPQRYAVRPCRGARIAGFACRTSKIHC